MNYDKYNAEIEAKKEHLEEKYERMKTTRNQKTLRKIKKEIEELEERIII